MRERLLPLVGLAAFAAALVLRGQADAHLAATTGYEDVYYLPPPSVLRVLSLGHDEALADLLWIRALVYTGDEYTHSGGLRYVFDYTDALLTLDPDFRAVYHWIATAGTYQPEAGDVSEVWTTIGILERGVARFPDDGELAWDLGATYAFELPGYLETEEERASARENAVDHLIRATELGAAPPWMMLSNAVLLARIGRVERAVEHLEAMYDATEDEGIRARIATRISDLRNETHADAFVEATRNAEEERIATYPWMSPSMYFLVGPRPAVDTNGALRDGVHRHAFDDEVVLESALLGEPEAAPP